MNNVPNSAAQNSPNSAYAPVQNGQNGQASAGMFANTPYSGMFPGYGMGMGMSPIMGMSMGMMGSYPYGTAAQMGQMSQVC